MGTYIVSQIFTAWDFGITDKKAAIIKHSSISNELKVNISSDKSYSYLNLVVHIVTSNYMVN